MCNRLTILAQTTQYRAVSQCEHGALHMHWDIATIRLRPSDFLTFARFLNRWGVSSEPNAEEGWCTFTRTQHGNVQLWIGHIGIVVSEGEFAAMTDLVQQAATTLIEAETRPATVQPALRNCPILTIDTSAIVLN